MKTHFLVVLEIDHDGHLTPDELCASLGVHLDSTVTAVIALLPDGTQGEFSITRCLGVNPARIEDVEDLLEDDDGTE